jgi:hypothetical protein
MLDFDKLSQELKEDTKVDELNLLQKQLTLPAIKHKWVARLIEQKRYLNNLERKKKMAKIAVLATLEEQGIPPGLPKASVEKKIDNSEALQKINSDIEETSLLIEYLEKVETIFRSMTYDIKNIIEINKLETT